MQRTDRFPDWQDLFARPHSLWCVEEHLHHWRLGGHLGHHCYASANPWQWHRNGGVGTIQLW